MTTAGTHARIQLVICAEGGNRTLTSCDTRFYRFKNNVLEEGIEPSHLTIYDFESYASTNSATPAHYFQIPSS
jgi:hypothetical protein